MLFIFISFEAMAYFVPKFHTLKYVLCIMNLEIKLKFINLKIPRMTSLETESAQLENNTLNFHQIFKSPLIFLEKNDVKCATVFLQ